MNKYLYLLFFCILFIVSGAHKSDDYAPEKNPKLMALLWQQHAAERRALCYQAFNLAQWRLDQALDTVNNNPAVIIDIDETVLDNSPESGYEILNNEDYNFTLWKKWTDQSIAEPIAGSVTFLQYAQQRNVEVFYVSNRMVEEIGSTMINLSKYDLPNLDSAHMLFKTTTSDKTKRRETVMADHSVLLYIGDNLGDFEAVFDKASTASRNQNVDELKNEFGLRFIVLPNTTYGGWEAALINNNWGATQQKKDSILVSKIKSFKP